MVFHPFLDEILIGKIKGCSPEGVHGNGGNGALAAGTRPGRTARAVARPVRLPVAAVPARGQEGSEVEAETSRGAREAYA